MAPYLVRLVKYVKIIKHDLLPKQKARKHNLKVEIDLYPYATELYDELNKIGIIDRIKIIPQLGVIKVSKKLQKTRYDYVMLQLYLHQLIKKHLQGQLQLTYNNKVKAYEFGKNFKYLSKNEKPTIGDVLQLLTIIYNIGHFSNTFTASRAVTMMANSDNIFYNLICSSSSDEHYKDAAIKILDGQNYQRMHLLNSLLILEKCDQTKQSIILAKAILYAYINENPHEGSRKLHYVFSIFRNVRTVSYMAYDLQIADTPLTIDLCNEKAMLLILKELLSEYNNTTSSRRLIESISKLLDDTVYNEISNAICYYKISKRIVAALQKEQDFTHTDFYEKYFISKDSVFNKSYSHKRDYMQSQILKLTFQSEHRHISKNLLADLEKINNTRVGYYDRHSGEQTILVSVKSKCDRHSKTLAAFKTLKCAISGLRKIENISPSDSRYLLCTKFFLFYLFDENPVVIKPTIDEKTCVLCTRGKNSRVTEINNLLKDSHSTDDVRHETDFMIKCLQSDPTNDTSICVPASIVIYQKNATGKSLRELDGIIIHPMRKEEQVIFLEAKNTANKPAFGEKCLKEKFDILQIKYSTEDIKIINHDAMMKYTV